MSCKTDFSANNDFTRAIMQELTAFLERFVVTGEEGFVDLRGLPMRESDKQQLEDLLGVGEVRATILVSGETQIWETALSGIWWVRHKGSEGKIISEQIVVTQIPEILKTHNEDAKAALKRLQSSFYSKDSREVLS